MNKVHVSDYRGPRGRFLTTWRILVDPYGNYQKWKQRFGDTFRLNALNGAVIATCNPENIRSVFAAPSHAVGQFAVGTIKPLLGSSSVLLQEGEVHRKQRKLLMPSFQGDLISHQADEIQEVALQAGNRWKPGEKIRVMDHSLDISLEVIIRVVFGIRDTQLVQICKQRVVEFVERFKPSLAFSRLLQRPLLGLSPWNQFVAARDACMALLQSEIDSRRASGERGDDLLSRLLNARYEDGGQMSDQQIREQLATMLFAGHETTQIAIAWAMSWLVRHPHFYHRLKEELRAGDLQDVVQHSKLLRGICNESLRLNPIVPDLVRTVKKPISFVDREIPGGANVALVSCLVHYDPEIFERPNVFNPDRWEDRTYKPHEFFPFGGGVRRCIGATLATLEMKVVVATWVKHFEFSLPPGTPEVEPVHRRSVVMGPKSGVELVVRKS